MIAKSQGDLPLCLIKFDCAKAFCKPCSNQMSIKVNCVGRGPGLPATVLKPCLISEIGLSPSLLEAIINQLRCTCFCVNVGRAPGLPETMFKPCMITEIGRCPSLREAIAHTRTHAHTHRHLQLNKYLHQHLHLHLHLHLYSHQHLHLHLQSCGSMRGSAGVWIAATRDVSARCEPLGEKAHDVRPRRASSKSTEPTAMCSRHVICTRICKS